MVFTKKKAYENLRYRIITQKLAPGELLKDKDLMEEYGIGRTPLRDIIIELQKEGLINRVPRAGTWVAPMDFAFLKQIAEIRIGLEGIAGELAAERISQEQLDQLEQILGKVAALEAEETVNAEALNNEELIRCESQFHNVIYAATKNQKLEALLKSYQGIGARFWHYLAYNREELLKQFESQRKMFVAIQKKDKTKCKEIMEQHIRDYMGIIDERISRIHGE
jgi:DNA-binding GntR family transcriptional regulator